MMIRFPEMTVVSPWNLASRVKELGNVVDDKGSVKKRNEKKKKKLKQTNKNVLAGRCREDWH